MTELTENARALFAGRNLAWATTIRADGSPHNTIVWADVEGDVVIFNTAVGRAKEKHLRENPNISLSVLDPENDGRFASITGTPEFSTDDGVEIIEALSQKYTGGAYGGHTEGEQRITVRVKPVKLVEQTGW
jgi:PPOX class probable F420-dependent enzyme